MRYLWLPVLLIALVVAPAPSRADFAAGLKAYDAGNFKTAMKEWLPLAQAGDAEAQFRVGRLYDVGEGVPPDGKSAVYWYEKAQVQGNLKATFNLALLYDLGKLVTQDYKRAFDLYSVAAAKGDIDSQVNLGMLYMGGRGVPRDFVKAYTWFFRAKAAGDKTIGKSIQYFSKVVPASDIQKAHDLVFGRPER